MLVEPKGYERPYALNCKEKLINLLKEKKFIEGNTTVELKSLSGGSKEIVLYANYDYFEFLTTPYIIEAMIQAEKEGYDAATVACAFDPGIEQAREVLEVPVIGITEAAFALSQAMGARRGSVGIVTITNRAVRKLNAIIDAYGFRSYMLPKESVRAIPTGIYIKASTVPTPESVEELKAVYIKVAKGLIKDGAEVLITGCGGLGPLLATEGLNEVDGVPILDPVTAGIKMAELLVEYKKQGICKSRRGPTVEEFKKGRTYFGLPS